MERSGAPRGFCRHCAKDRHKTTTDTMLTSGHLYKTRHKNAKVHPCSSVPTCLSKRFTTSSPTYLCRTFTTFCTLSQYPHVLQGHASPTGVKLSGVDLSP